MPPDDVAQVPDDATQAPELEFFGDFLVREGVITGPQLRQAIDHIYFLNRTLGELAIARGYMYAQDVSRALDLQRGCDRMFGELAVDLELLTQAQVDELLLEQSARQCRVGEALVELGHVAEDAMHKHLSTFEAGQAALLLDPRETPRDLQETDAPAVIDLFVKQALRGSMLCVKVGRPRPLCGSGLPEFRVSALVPTRPALAIGLACGEELGRGLGATVRGTFVAQITLPEIEQTLREFLTGVVALVTSEPVDLSWGDLPDAGHAYDFVSPQGAGVLILQARPDPRDTRRPHGVA